MSLIRAENVSFSYTQEKKILDNLNFSIERGEYIALVGLNGSGKSTLSRLLAQFFNPQSGKLILEKNVLPGIVFQHPKEQIVAGVVERDTGFGPANLKKTKDEIELRTIECLSVVGLMDKALCRSYDLSLGQTQRLAFAGILALFPDFLILDEVTSSLDPQARSSLLDFIEQWNKKGCTVLHVTHDADEAMRAQRVIVLEQGKITFDGKAADFTQSQQFKTVFPLNTVNFVKKTQAQLDALETTLSVENLSFFYEGGVSGGKTRRKENKLKSLKKQDDPASDISRQNKEPAYIFKNLSFTLKKGTLTALTGPSGCGKSTLFECIAGLQNYSGSIKAVCQPSLCLQDSDAALYEKYAADDVAYGPIKNGVSGKKLFNIVKDSMDKVSLPYEQFGNRPTFNLSGGEKRKLAIAGIVALDADIILFDEPTAGLDTESRKKILSMMRLLAAEGKTVLFSTHRYDEILYADSHILWEDLVCPKPLNSPQDLPQKSLDPAGIKPPALKELSSSHNTAMISSIKKAGAAIIAPPEIPKSPVGALPAVLKFILFFALFIAELLVRGIYENIAMFFLSIIYLALSRYPVKKLAGGLKVFLPWIFIFAAIEFIFFTSTGTVLFEWKFIVITDAKIISLARTFLKTLSVLFTMSVFIYTTSEREILDGLNFFLKPLSFIAPKAVRYFVLVVGIMFRYIPMIMEIFTGILKTQIIRGTFADARGLKKVFLVFPLIVPLLLQSFRKAWFMADALIARYFN